MCPKNKQKRALSYFTNLQFTRMKILVYDHLECILVCLCLPIRSTIHCNHFQPMLFILYNLLLFIPWTSSPWANPRLCTLKSHLIVGISQIFYCIFENNMPKNILRWKLGSFIGFYKHFGLKEFSLSINFFSGHLKVKTLLEGFIKLFPSPQASIQLLNCSKRI